MERQDQILELLYNNTGEWLSGEEISSRLGISRTAVWKHINQLRESGYIIESSTRLGHKLIPGNEMLTEFEIRRRLETRIFGRNEIHIFDETNSTNIQAFMLASSGSPEGTIVLAEKQTGGKGRLGRSWASPYKKNLYLSYILRPSIPTIFAPRLTLVTAVAVSDTFDRFGVINHRIKWPNDILFNDRKLSGILTEMKGDCDSIDFIITGIGININSDPDDYPKEIRETAISLKEITGSEINRADFLKQLLFNIEKRYHEFLDGRFNSILSEWTAKASIINQCIKVSNFEESYTGIVTEVNSDGNLVLMTDNGIKIVNSGDINFIQGT